MTDKCWCGGKATTLYTLDDVAEGHCADSPYHDPIATGYVNEVRRLYIAGPMTGYPDCNYPMFNAAAEHLRSQGFEVVNPAEVSIKTRGHYVDYLRADLLAMLGCDAVATLEGWEYSTGARNEVMVAGTLRMPVAPVAKWAARPSLTEGIIQ